MPFTNRHASPFPQPRTGLMKNHPIIFATTAATAGVLLGGFVAVQLLGTPAKQDAGSKPPQVALQTSAPPHIAEVPSQSAETTGSATTETAAAAKTASVVDCSNQTWPNLTRDCMKNGGAVVIADKPAAPPIAPVTASAAPAVNSANNAPPLVAPPIATTTPEIAPAATTAALSPVQAADKPEAKPEAQPKQVAKKAKRKAKKPEKQELNDEDNHRAAFAADDSDERFDRTDGRADRSRRVVTRWRERGYDVPDEDDSSRRHVVVIRRGGSPFGALFGGFRDDDD
jgi:hypothetical protein